MHDLEKLRRDMTSATSAGLDDEISRMQEWVSYLLMSASNSSTKCSALNNIEHQLLNLIEKHNDRSLTGKAKSYLFQAKKTKEQIKELSDDVLTAKINFMVSLSLRFITFADAYR